MNSEQEFEEWATRNNIWENGSASEAEMMLVCFRFGFRKGAIHAYNRCAALAARIGLIWVLYNVLKWLWSMA